MRASRIVRSVIWSIVGLVPVWVQPALRAGVWEVGFEAADGFAAGPVVARGWHVASGTVEVVSEPVASGAQSLRLGGGTEAATLATELSVASDAFALELQVLPAVGASFEESTFLEFGFSALAFKAAGGSTEVWAFDGRGGEEGQWVRAAVVAEPRAWLRLRVVHHLAAGVWSVAVNGGAPSEPLGIFGTRQATVPVAFFGGAAGATYLDDFRVSVGTEATVAVPAAIDAREEDDPARPKGAEGRPSGAAAVVAASKAGVQPGAAGPVTTELQQRRETRLKAKLAVFTRLE